MDRLKWIKETNKLPVKAPEIHIGKNCRIHSTVAMGDMGHSMEKDENGNWVRCNHHGGIRIDDDVHIGEFSVIKRATLEDSMTYIGKDVKICSYVNVAHNCIIGAHTFMGPHVCLNGSVTIGEGSWIAGHAVIGQHAEIGAGAIVGLGAIVLPRAVIPDGETWVGSPAVPIQYAGNYIHPDFRHGEGLKLGKYNHIHGGVEVGNDVTIRSNVELRRGTIIGNGCYIDSGVKSSGGCEIGNGVTIRYDAIIARNVVIEDDVFIAPQVMFINIPFKGRKRRGPTLVCKGAQIGTNTTIDDGVKIGPGVIIGAKAFVNRDCIEPGVDVGVPARRVGG